MLSYGLEEEHIKVCAKTGFVVDIKGWKEAEPADKSHVNMIALRADIDGLPIPENNPNLSYRTKTNFAHMCGHDGHIATLLSAAEVLIKKRDLIPKNKTIRLLF